MLKNLTRSIYDFILKSGFSFAISMASLMDTIIVSASKLFALIYDNIFIFLFCILIITTILLKVVGVPIVYIVGFLFLLVPAIMILAIIVAILYISYKGLLFLFERLIKWVKNNKWNIFWGACVIEFFTIIGVYEHLDPQYVLGIV